MQTLKRRRVEHALGPRGRDAKMPTSLMYARDSQTAAERRRLLVEATKGEFFPRHLTLLREKEFPLEEWPSRRCPPSQVWLSHSELLVGTKCNSLLRLDPERATATSVPLPQVEARHSGAGDRLSCGIHAIAINPSHTMLATGGAEPEDCAVLGLPNFEHLQTMRGAGRGSRCLGSSCLLIEICFGTPGA
ncbi:unnamed protein product [Ostreobium quekettii]|uniref:DDB1- and CUL4-associated factor 12 beta-propeller domain-containing protein n=1 Tax=Ostreobium quekettii TaxID=121088 RepID=A0A8S1IXG1_9CHLO|nr:unnamed protein product [Ostreobium quekettii]